MLVHRGTAPQRDVVRAKVALMAYDGQTTAAIAAALGISLPSVSMWRGRVAHQGVAGLREAQRPGRPRRIGDAQRLQLLAPACEPAEERGRATPTLDELCERAAERGVVKHISRSHLQRILQAGDVRPHRVRQWLHSPESQFREEVNAICALYRQAPKGSAVLSIDEKIGMQAIERSKHTDCAPQPGRARRREFEYIRHGTQALTAALDVQCGARPGALHRSAHTRRLGSPYGGSRTRVPQGRRARGVGQPEHASRAGGVGWLQHPAQRALRLSLHAAAAGTPRTKSASSQSHKCGS